MDRFSAHMDRSWDMILKGKTTLALAAARQALEIDANSADVYNLIGYIYALDGDFEGAVENYKKAIEIDEWFLEPVLNAAEILSHPDADPQEAIRLCNVATNMVLSPEEYADALLIEVDALLGIGDDVTARERLSQIPNGEDLPAVYQSNIGRAFLDAGDRDKALEYVLRVSRMDPSLSDPWYAIGLIRRDEGRRVDAVTAFLKTRMADLEIPRVPWALTGEQVANRTKKVIESLADEMKSYLGGVEIIVEEYPSQQDVIEEMDPRRVFLCTDIDPERGVFRKLKVFTLNLERIASPMALDDEMARLLIDDLCDGSPMELGRVDKTEVLV